MADEAQAVILADLERAELAARERRLAAVAEAERILADATARAAAVERSAGERIATALDELRRRHLARAEAEVARIAAELEALERRPERDIDDPRFASAVAGIVAAVLGEAAATGSEPDRRSGGS